jgi:DNA-binding transcriptional LysR family regulator
MIMSIDELEAFVTIAQRGGFGRAADRLHRSQPAISRRIAMLEQALRTQLFERVPGGVVLTQSGRAFLPYAESVLASLKDGAEAVHGLERGEHGTVSLALVGTLADARFAALLRDFGQRFPDVTLGLRTATSQEVSELVRSGEATLGLRYFADPDPSLISEAVMEEKLVVACAPGHRLAGRRVRNMRELDGERWVTFPQQKRRRESFVTALEHRLAAVGLAAAEIVPIDSLTAQKRFVEAGLGIALLIASGVEEGLRLGTLKLIDVPALHGPVPVTLVRRRNGYLGGAARALIASIGGAA